MPSSFLICGGVKGAMVSTCETAALKLNLRMRSFCDGLAHEVLSAVAALVSCSTVALNWGV
jgi:hypothetical protein